MPANYHWWHGRSYTPPGSVWANHHTSGMVKELKRVSNLWLKEKFHLSAFEWQAGYADFSVSQSNLEQVKRYIVNQEEHHKKRSFQDEVRELFRLHRME